MKKISVPHLLGFMAGSIIVGSVGALATTPNIQTWYIFLIKPPLNPPSWIFGPVWTLLFAMMGAAAYLVWQKGIKKQAVNEALSMFVGQFLLNILWSFLFFGLHSPLSAFICILFLWGAIIKTILMFHKIQWFAGWLLMPYLFWVSFATYLNFAIYILNK